MPNHIYNVVTFDCPHERAAEILSAVEMEGCELGSIDFEKLIPMPEDVYRGPLGRDEMKQYPGEKNWYDWSLNHWGTKWNAYGFDELPQKDDALVFNTAWSAVPEVISKLSQAKRLQVAKLLWQHRRTLSRKQLALMVLKQSISWNVLTMGSLLSTPPKTA